MGFSYQDLQAKLQDNAYLKYLLQNKLIEFKNLECLSNSHISIYSGKGPSNDLHLGHLFLLKIIKEIKETIGASLTYMISDDEKYFNGTLTESAVVTITSLILTHFKDVEILQNTKDIGTLYPFALPFIKFFKINRISSLLGVKPNDNLGKLFYAPIQCSVVNYLHNSDKSVLIITGKDQIPYFREMDRFLNSIGKSVSYLYITDFPNLHLTSKMSSSSPKTAIFYNDFYLTQKINSAKTGSPLTLQEHKLNGVKITEDFFYYLTLYFNLNLKQNDYFSGKISAAEFKSSISTYLKLNFKNLIS